MHRTALIAGLALAAAPAAAQSPGEDVRCLLASNIFAQQEKDPAKKQVATYASFFYLGRVGTLTEAQLRTLIPAQARVITPANAGPEMTACARRMQQAGTAVQALSQQLRPPAK